MDRDEPSQNQSPIGHTRDDILQELQDQSRTDLNDIHYRFIPRGALLSVLTPKRVRKFVESIVHSGNMNNGKLDSIVNNISPDHGENCHCKIHVCTGGRIIFVTLLLIRREDTIESFYTQENPSVCDKDLPLIQEDMSDSMTMPKAFHTFSPIEKELFRHFQWKMRSPYLTMLGADQDYKELDSQVALPWIYLKQVTDNSDPMAGEYSYVQRIKIDKFHHEFNHEDFALKIFDLRNNDDARFSFEQEVEANKRTPIHDRIVPLLTAFEHKEKLCLLFPWADGNNLQDLWKGWSTFEYTNMDEKLATWYTTGWLVAECSGIADSLVEVHNSSQDNDQRNSTKPSSQLHMDIKPENILCFGSSIGLTEGFRLKLADFGLAEPLKPDGILKMKKEVHTKTYRPPETNFEEHVSQNYDIWCLGCLYLDFITWATLGWQGIERSGQQRMTETHDEDVSAAMGHYYEDTFFKKIARYPKSLPVMRRKMGREVKTLDHSGRLVVMRRYVKVWLERPGIRIQCIIKNEVAKHIRILEQHPGCDELLKKFLSFIQTSMLVVDTKDRVDSREVQKFFNGLRET